MNPYTEGEDSFSIQKIELGFNIISLQIARITGVFNYSAFKAAVVFIPAVFHSLIAL